MCNTKICKRCNKEQPIDNFYKVPSMKDGHDNTCKTCRKELRRLRDGVEIIPLVTEGTLICPVCKQELPVDKFDTMLGARLEDTGCAVTAVKNTR